MEKIVSSEIYLNGVDNVSSEVDFIIVVTAGVSVIVRCTCDTNGDGDNRLFSLFDRCNDEFNSRTCALLHSKL